MAAVKLKIGNRDEVYSPAINAKGYINPIHGIDYSHNHPEPIKFPTNSFPLWWKKINGAKSYAILMESFDSHKTCGLPFINWIVLNIKENELTENQSLIEWIKWKSSDKKEFADNILWQGCNSTSPEVYSDSKGERVQLKNNVDKKYKSETAEDACMFHGPISYGNETLSVLTIYGLDTDAESLCYVEKFGDDKKYCKFNKPFFAGDFIQGISGHIVGTWTLVFKFANNVGVPKSRK